MPKRLWGELERIKRLTELPQYQHLLEEGVEGEGQITFGSHVLHKWVDRDSSLLLILLPAPQGTFHLSALGSAHPRNKILKIVSLKCYSSEELVVASLLPHPILPREVGATTEA